MGITGTGASVPQALLDPTVASVSDLACVSDSKNRKCAQISNTNTQFIYSLINSVSDTHTVPLGAQKNQSHSKHACSSVSLITVQSGVTFAFLIVKKILRKLI